MAMIFRQPGKTGIGIKADDSAGFKNGNNCHSSSNERRKKMKLNSVIFCLCAGLCSSALIDSAFSMNQDPNWQRFAQQYQQQQNIQQQFIPLNQQQNAQQQFTAMPMQNAQQQFIGMPMQNAQQQFIGMPLQNAQQQFIGMLMQNAQPQFIEMPLQNAQQQFIGMLMQNAQPPFIGMPMQNAQPQFTGQNRIQHPAMQQSNKLKTKEKPIRKKQAKRSARSIPESVAYVDFDINKMDVNANNSHISSIEVKPEAIREMQYTIKKPMVKPTKFSPDYSSNTDSIRLEDLTQDHQLKTLNVYNPEDLAYWHDHIENDLLQHLERINISVETLYTDAKTQRSLWPNSVRNKLFYSKIKVSGEDRDQLLKDKVLYKEQLTIDDIKHLQYAKKEDFYSKEKYYFNNLSFGQITSISDGFFSKETLKGIGSIVLPDSIVEIQDGAFFNSYTRSFMHFVVPYTLETCGRLCKSRYTNGPFMRKKLFITIVCDNNATSLDMQNIRNMLLDLGCSSNKICFRSKDNRYMYINAMKNKEKKK